MSNIVLHEIDVLTVIHDRLIALIMIFLQHLQITRNLTLLKVHIFSNLVKNFCKISNESDIPSFYGENCLKAQ